MVNMWNKHAQFLHGSGSHPPTVQFEIQPQEKPQLNKARQS